MNPTPTTDSDGELMHNIIKVLYPHIDDGGAHTVKMGKINQLVKITQAYSTAHLHTVLVKLKERKETYGLDKGRAYWADVEYVDAVPVSAIDELLGETGEENHEQQI